MFFFQASNITLTIGQAFELAYDMFLKTNQPGTAAADKVSAYINKHMPSAEVSRIVCYF